MRGTQTNFLAFLKRIKSVVVTTFATVNKLATSSGVCIEEEADVSLSSVSHVVHERAGVCKSHTTSRNELEQFPLKMSFIEIIFNAPMCVVALHVVRHCNSLSNRLLLP